MTVIKSEPSLKDLPSHSHPHDLDEPARPGVLLRGRGERLPRQARPVRRPPPGLARRLHLLADPSRPARPRESDLMTSEGVLTTARGLWHVVVVDDSPDDRAEVRRLLLQGSDDLPLHRGGYGSPCGPRGARPVRGSAGLPGDRLLPSRHRRAGSPQGAHRRRTASRSARWR